MRVLLQATGGWAGEQRFLVTLCDEAVASLQPVHQPDVVLSDGTPVITIHSMVARKVYSLCPLAFFACYYHRGFVPFGKWTGTRAEALMYQTPPSRVELPAGERVDNIDTIIHLIAPPQHPYTHT